MVSGNTRNVVDVAIIVEQIDSSSESSTGRDSLDALLQCAFERAAERIQHSSRQFDDALLF